MSAVSLRGVDLQAILNDNNMHIIDENVDDVIIIKTSCENYVMNAT